MLRGWLGVAVLLSGSAAGAASPSTDFGIRSVGSPLIAEGPAGSAPVGSAPVFNAVSSSTSLGLSGAAVLAARWGRVTSTWRTPRHNRAVGGVPNSFHIHGRAIDIARAPGVSHRQVDSAFRSAGYRVIESLDEGDHSHFAFAWGSAPVRSASASRSDEVTQWRIVYAPGSRE